MDLVEKHPDERWNWRYGVSANPNLTMEFVRKHPDRPWSWYLIGMNPDVRMEFLEMHPDKPWDWEAISSNPNLTMEYIENHPDEEWDWEGISWNLFSFHPILRIRKLPVVSETQRILLLDPCSGKVASDIGKDGI